MAQTHPHAVYVADNGFYAVDYAALGLRMCTIEEWDTLGMNAVLAEAPQSNSANTTRNR